MISSSVMRKEVVEVVWVDIPPISVDINGNCSVDIVITATKAPGICNIRENTKIVCPDSILPQQIEQKSTALASIVNVENRINAKHFIVTSHASEYLRSLNAKDSEYTDKLVKKTNLFCVDLEAKHKFQSLTSDFKIDSVNPEDKKLCARLSQFQQDILPWFRKLTDEELIKKTKERYDLDAFNSRVASPEIVIYTLTRENELLGTFTLNLHITSDAPESMHFGYLSDLFVAKGLEDDADFISHFISCVFAKIVENFPKIKVLSVMAAAGDPTIPIVKCFNHAKAAGLIHPFTRAEQERLGVVAQFTLHPNNAGNSHLLSLPPGILTKFSMLSEQRKQSTLAQDEKHTYTNSKVTQ